MLLLALTAVAIIGAATVAAEDAQLDAAAVEDKFVGARKDGPPPKSSTLPADVVALRPPGRCLIRWCDSIQVYSLCTYYYRWYGAKVYRLGEALPDGGRVVGRCTRVPWCRSCYRCLARKRARCLKELPRFTKWWYCRLGATGQLTPVLKSLAAMTPAEA